MLIAVSGGIGSGKTIVSRMLVAMGFKVYDCDSRAKAIMDADEDIKFYLKRDIHPDAVGSDGKIDRKKLSSVVFTDHEALQKLNGIVHAAVRKDILSWTCRHRDKPLLFVETAIMYQSGLDKIVDAVWEIQAPHDLRVSRVMSRSNCTRDEVLSRIRSQNIYVPEKPHSCVTYINNDGKNPLLPLLERLLCGFR